MPDPTPERPEGREASDLVRAARGHAEWLDLTGYSATEPITSELLRELAQAVEGTAVSIPLPFPREGETDEIRTGLLIRIARYRQLRWLPWEDIRDVLLALEEFYGGE